VLTVQLTATIFCQNYFHEYESANFGNAVTCHRLSDRQSGQRRKLRQVAALQTLLLSETKRREHHR
jgi:hypothetical protein